MLGIEWTCRSCCAVAGLARGPPCNLALPWQPTAVSVALRPRPGPSGDGIDQRQKTKDKRQKTKDKRQKAARDHSLDGKQLFAPTAASASAVWSVTCANRRSSALRRGLTALFACRAVFFPRWANTDDLRDFARNRVDDSIDGRIGCVGVATGDCIAKVAVDGE